MIDSGNLADMVYVVRDIRDGWTRERIFLLPFLNPFLDCLVIIQASVQVPEGSRPVILPDRVLGRYEVFDEVRVHNPAVGRQLQKNIVRYIAGVRIDGV